MMHDVGGAQPVFCHVRINSVSSACVGLLGCSRVLDTRAKPLSFLVVYVWPATSLLAGPCVASRFSLCAADTGAVIRSGHVALCVIGVSVYRTTCKCNFRFRNVFWNNLSNSTKKLRRRRRLDRHGVNEL